MAERLEIEAIASKLTEAQRRYLLLVTPEGRTGCPRGQGHIAAKVLRSLPDGLIREAWGGDNYRFHLTDRGRDVRAYLTEGTEQVITDELVELKPCPFCGELGLQVRARVEEQDALHSRVLPGRGCDG